VKSKKYPKIDIGLTWAKGVNIWGQLGTVAGVANIIMMLGVFYTTVVYPNIKIPLWAYVLIVVLGASAATWFIIRWGISGYYRFFSRQSELSEVHRKIELIMENLHIEDTKRGDKNRKK